MATLKTSLEANYDRQADRQTKKAPYRGRSYRSAQKWISLDAGGTLDGLVIEFKFNQMVHFLMIPPPPIVSMLFIYNPLPAWYKKGLPTPVAIAVKSGNL